MLPYVYAIIRFSDCDPLSHNSSLELPGLDRTSITGVTLSVRGKRVNAHLLTRTCMYDMSLNNSRYESPRAGLFLPDNTCK